MGRATVTALLAVRNQEAYIGEAVESVLAQTSPPEETIAVDDGSTDRTPEILRAFAPRVRVVRQDPAGVGAARNRGLREAAGDFVAFLDGDDRWRPDKIAAVRSAAETGAGTDLLTSDAVSFSADGRAARALCARRRAGESSLFRRLLAGERAVFSSVVVRRAAALEAGAFRTDFRCPAGVEDWEFLLRLARRGARAEHLPRILVEYRIHPESAIQSRRSDLLEDALRAIRLHADAPESDPEILAVAQAQVRVESAIRHLAAGDLRPARAELAAAFAGRPAVRTAVLWALACTSPRTVAAVVGLRRRRPTARTTDPLEGF